MEIAAILKIIDVVMALVNSGFTFDAAFKRVSDMIKARRDAGATEITDDDLRSVLDGTDAKLAAARVAFEAALKDANTPTA